MPRNGFGYALEANDKAEFSGTSQPREKDVQGGSLTRPLP